MDYIARYSSAGFASGPLPQAYCAFIRYPASGFTLIRFSPMRAKLIFCALASSIARCNKYYAMALPRLHITPDYIRRGLSTQDDYATPRATAWTSRRHAQRLLFLTSARYHHHADTRRKAVSFAIDFVAGVTILIFYRLKSAAAMTQGSITSLRLNTILALSVNDFSTIELFSSLQAGFSTKTNEMKCRR